MFSFGIEPSTTSTNGASSVPSAASRNGLRNSSPPRDGSSTLLCRCTLGSPGIAPSSTSSMLGWPAAVIDTVSPSQDMPSEIHRMWTSSTPDTGSVVAMDPSSRRRQCSVLVLVLELQRLHQQLLALEQPEVQPTARPAAQRELLVRRLLAAGTAAAGGRHAVDHELRALEHRVLRQQAE